MGGDNGIRHYIFEISYSVPNLASIPVGTQWSHFDWDNICELEPVSERDRALNSAYKLRLVCQQVQKDTGQKNIRLKLCPNGGPIFRFDFLIARMHISSACKFPSVCEMYAERDGKAWGRFENINVNIDNGTLALQFHMPLSNYVLVPVKERAIQRRICEDDSNLFSTAEHADITFVVRGIEIKAHKCVLASRSEYFSRMFASGMKENETSVIKVEDFDADTFRLALQSLYAGFSSSITFDSALQLLPLMNKYQFKKLYRDCFDFVAMSLSKENVEKAIKWAVEHKNEELQTYCFRVMKQKMSEKERWGILYNLDKDIVGKFFSILE